MSNDIDPARIQRNLNWGRRIRGLLLLLMGCLTIAAIFLGGGLALLIVGWLVITCGILEMLETFQAPSDSARRTSYFSGGMSVIAGCLLLAQPQFVLRGLSVFVAAVFLFDGLNRSLGAWRGRATETRWKWKLAAGIVLILMSLVLIVRWPVAGLAVVFFVIALRMFATGWALLLGRPTPRQVEDQMQVGLHPDRALGLPEHAEFARLDEQCTASDERRLAANTYWCCMFIAVFFAIHLGRMQVAWNAVGMISPLVAVIGDIATAFIVAYVILLPSQLAWRRLIRPVERQGWNRLFARAEQGKGPGLLGRFSGFWLRHRYRISRRIRQVSRSPRAALRWGLHVGLPVTAILIAVNPIWGFSWFFNSESWATEVWNRWAEARTDTWREQMILAVRDQYGATGMKDDQLFRIEPPGIAAGEDFSFLVLGDTGEGDASQFCLKDQFLKLGQRPDVKFLVVSSDVIYPTGAMSDYEGKFYLPFKGFTKPIYAIPGNHDWYDALEGFAANFFEPDAARMAIHARIVTDKRLTSTTDRRIEKMLRQADQLRTDFGISAGHQRGPFFEFQTDRFSLIAADTGVLRSVDNAQWTWLKGALDRANGKSTIVILGHPLYAGGRYQGGDDFASGEWVHESHPPAVPGLMNRADTQPFAAIHQLLRERKVPIVMAGDTHYFEHYRENYSKDGTDHTMHHFVNGGGGAYISIGTPMDWPRKPAVPDCGFFPRKDFLIDKLGREMPTWKSPLWFWVNRLGGWPFSAEAMAGAFDYNHAPYLQSFVEIRVENSAKRVRIIVHSADGPLKWRQMQCYGAEKPSDKSDDDPVEYTVPMQN